MWDLGIFSVGFVLSFFLIQIIRRLAPRLALVDHPNSRKQHSAPTPLVGGLGMFIALWIASLLFLPAEPKHNIHIALASGILLLGLLDDRFGLKALPRLMFQAFLALGMIYLADIRLYELGNLNFSGNVQLGILSVPLTIIGMVGVINAVNFSDGLDGLAGGLVLVAFGCLLLLSQFAGAHRLSLELILTIGVLMGFWVLNARYFRRNKAAVFMGDAGSMLLGFLLAWYFISMSQGEERLFSPVTTLWIFALPLFDTVGMMLRRILHGRSPFSADREHLHHIFLRAGFSVSKTVTVMLLIAVALGMVGVLGELLNVPEGVMFWGFIILFGVYFFAMMHAWKVMRWIRAHQP